MTGIIQSALTSCQEICNGRATQQLPRAGRLPDELKSRPRSGSVGLRRWPSSTRIAWGKRMRQGCVK